MMLHTKLRKVQSLCILFLHVIYFYEVGSLSSVRSLVGFESVTYQLSSNRNWHSVIEVFLYESCLRLKLTFLLFHFVNTFLGFYLAIEAMSFTDELLKSKATPTCWVITHIMLLNFVKLRFLLIMKSSHKQYAMLTVLFSNTTVQLKANN